MKCLRCDHGCMGYATGISIESCDHKDVSTPSAESACSTTDEDGASLIELLNAITTKVFDNERSFMENCWRYGKEADSWDELLEFYMSSETCRISFLVSCGATVTDTVKTKDVLDWIQKV